MWCLKVCSAHDCLKGSIKVDTGGACGALLNDLSKALEWILHDLFNVKLHEHSLDSHTQQTHQCCYLVENES